jgi:hypothetical protein
LLLAFSKMQETKSDEVIEGVSMTCTAVIEARQKLMESGLAPPDSFKGCTEKQIRLIESRASLRLPKCYRDFLAVMGVSAGNFLAGNDYCFPFVLKFRKSAEALLQSYQASFRLPAPAFVFIISQGCAFLFFYCEDSVEDPPVFMFTEDDSEPRRVFDSFSSWLLTAVEKDIALYQELKENRKQKEKEKKGRH